MKRISYRWKNADAVITEYYYTILSAESNDSGINTDSAKELIIGIIDTFEVPVIVGFIKPNGGTHFVLASGFFEDGSICIKDPASKNYTRLSQYLDQGYIIHRIYAYSR